MFNKFILKIKTTLLLMLPLGFYIFILRKFTKTRMTNYVGILGKDPVAYVVYNDVIMVDLNQLQI